MAIVSREYMPPREQHGGARLISIVFTSDTGEKYVVKKTINGDADIDAELGRAERSLIEQLANYEIDRIVNNIKNGLLSARVANGLSPTKINAKWASSEQIQRAIFNWFLTSSSNDARHVVPAIEALSDVELMAMLKIDQSTVNAIRQRAALLSQITNLMVMADG